MRFKQEAEEQPALSAPGCRAWETAASVQSQGQQIRLTFLEPRHTRSILSSSAYAHSLHHPRHPSGPGMPFDEDETVSHPFLPQDRAEQGCALAKLGANTAVTLLPNLLSPALGGQKADILHIILQRSRVSQRTPGPNILLPCCNCFLEGGEHFHFLPELS